jgi:hypothetical protein
MLPEMEESAIEVEEIFIRMIEEALEVTEETFIMILETVETMVGLILEDLDLILLEGMIEDLIITQEITLDPAEKDQDQVKETIELVDLNNVTGKRERTDILETEEV